LDPVLRSQPRGGVGGQRSRVDAQLFVRAEDRASRWRRSAVVWSTASTTSSRSSAGQPDVPADLCGVLAADRDDVSDLRDAASAQRDADADRRDVRAVDRDVEADDQAEKLDDRLERIRRQVIDRLARIANLTIDKTAWPNLTPASLSCRHTQPSSDGSPPLTALRSPTFSMS
jgi:hypothetical protein